MAKLTIVGRRNMKHTPRGAKGEQYTVEYQLNSQSNGAKLLSTFFFLSLHSQQRNVVYCEQWKFHLAEKFLIKIETRIR